MTTLGDYKVRRPIGQGNFAKVRLATHTPTGTDVAIKCISKVSLNESGMEKLNREVEIMKLIDHPNIVKLYQVIDKEDTIYLIMEYAPGGELFDYLVKHGKLSESEARAKFRQIVSAVEYLHSNNIVHRDLKAENLLLDEKGNIKIADFGFSNIFSSEKKLDTFCGSPPYAAPELFEGKKYEGAEVDIWSIGVVLYTLVTGGLPFDGKNIKELRERILKGKYRTPFYVTMDCEKLMKNLLAVNPQKRWPLIKVMSDHWINIGYTKKLTPYRPPSNKGIDEARLLHLQSMGYNKRDIEESVKQQRFDSLHALYLLIRLPIRSTTNRSAADVPINEKTPTRERAQPRYVLQRQADTSLVETRTFERNGLGRNTIHSPFSRNYVRIVPNPISNDSKQPGFFSRFTNKFRPSRPGNSSHSLKSGNAQSFGSNVTGSWSRPRVNAESREP